MKKNLNRLILLLWICHYGNILVAQNPKIDSLKTLLADAVADTMKVSLLNNISLELLNAGNIPDAKKYADEALALAERLNFRQGISHTYSVLGNLFSYEDYKHEALKFYHSALKIQEQTGDKKGMALSYKNLGWLHVNRNEDHEAMDKFQKSLKLYEEIGSYFDIANAYHNIGCAQMFLGHYPDALRNLTFALKQREEIGDKNEIATSYMFLAALYHYMENYTEAMKNYQTCLKLREEIGHTTGMAITYLEMGALCLKYKKISEAGKYLHKGLALSLQTDMKWLLELSYQRLAELDSMQGNFKSAYERYKLYIRYRDSLENKENDQKFVRRQMQFEFEKKEDSLRQVQLLTQERFEAQRSRNKFYLGITLLLVLISFLAYLNFRNQKRLSRLKEKLYVREKAELELQSLRAQLNPHFMFNSLNAIQELILLNENEKSHTYLARFAKLLRMLLENAENPFVTLHKEIDFLELYLSLEKLRIPDLQYSISVDPSVNLGETRIPNMVLQPYIENALWHGLSHKQGDRKLKLRIYRENEAILYDIVDNGVGRKKAAEIKSLYRKEHRSKGMELLRKRFKLLSEEYNSQIETRVEDIMNNGSVRGTRVSIKIPDTLFSSHILNSV